VNNLDQIYADSDCVADYADGYFAYLSKVMGEIDSKAIERFVDTFLQARKQGSWVYFIGNGGSATTASHFVNDIGFGTRSWDKPFKVMSLNDNCAVMTALANDNGYENMFVDQLKVYLKPEDVVVMITASGNSENLVHAVDYANSIGAHTIGLTSFDGGIVRERCKACIHVPAMKGEYGPAEDAHMIIDHLVSSYLIRLVRSEAAAQQA